MSKHFKGSTGTSLIIEKVDIKPIACDCSRCFHARLNHGTLYCSFKDLINPNEKKCLYYHDAGRVLRSRNNGAIITQKNKKKKLSWITIIKPITCNGKQFACKILPKYSEDFLLELAAISSLIEKKKSDDVSVSYSIDNVIEMRIYKTGSVVFQSAKTDILKDIYNYLLDLK